MIATCRVLVVEDEYFLANDLEAALRLEGAEIAGPIDDFSEALAQVEYDGFDAAVIDINLHDEPAYPLADKLVEQRIPFVFATGYSAEVIPHRFWEVTRFEKPYDVTAIAKRVVELAKLRRSERQRTPRQ